SCLFFSRRRRHTRLVSDWSSDVCSSDLRRATEFRTVKVVQTLAWIAGGGLLKFGGAPVFDVSARNSAIKAMTAIGRGSDAVADEIGRASCREGGWKWVGRVGLRTKT